MTKQAKNYQRLQHIVEYCEKIKVAAEVFNNSYDTFADDKNYQARDVCSFYILQIGELVGGLTDDFKAENSHIPWEFKHFHWISNSPFYNFIHCN